MPPKKKKAASTGAKKKSGSPKGESGAAAARAAAEEERKRLAAELGVATGARAAQEAAARTLEAELAALRQRHTLDAATASDVLSSQQRLAAAAEEVARGLEAQLAEARAQAAALQRQLDDAVAAAAAAAAASDDEHDPAAQPEMRRIISQSRRLEERLAVQAGEAGALRERLRGAEAELAAEQARSAALAVKAQSRSELRFIHSAPFLVHVRRERLSGGVPPAACLARPGAALDVAGWQLVLALPQGMHMLDLGSSKWRGGSGSSSMVGARGSCCGGSAGAEDCITAAAAATPPPATQHVTGRAVCSMGLKLLGFGGEFQGRLLPASTQYLHPDLLAWLPAPPPGDATAAEPLPRTHAALAYCPHTNSAYLFGGRGEGGSVLGDLWRLDLASMGWTRLDKMATRMAPLSDRARTPCAYEAPPPLEGAALAVSPDGGRLWLMGGRLEGGWCSKALHWFDCQMHYWAAVPPSSTWAIDSRCHHVMACVGRFLVVAGGLCYSAAGLALHRQDVLIYDPAANSWDALTDSAFELAPEGANEPHVVVTVAPTDNDCCAARRSTSSSGGGGSSKQGRQGGAGRSSSGGGSGSTFLGAGTCAFADGKLLLLKAPGGSGSSVSELWSVELALPEAIEQQAQAAQRRMTIYTDLTLKEERVGASSVRLSWRAPTAGSDKLLSFKLMLTNAEGRSREAYEGPETMCEVTGLAANAQCVFAVKALYDDASFLWSQPVLVTTAKKSSGGGGGGKGGGGNGGAAPARGGK